MDALIALFFLVFLSISIGLVVSYFHFLETVAIVSRKLAFLCP